MLFMVIERFKGRDPGPIYARLRDHGRAMPDGLRYVESWIEANFDRWIERRCQQYYDPSGNSKTVCGDTPSFRAVASTKGLKEEPGCRSPCTARLNWL